MKKAFVAALGVALLCCMVANVHAVPNANAKWALHNAGVHDAKANTCDFVLTDCTGIVTDGGVGGERNDVYLIVVDVGETDITATRYGICCDGPFYFYGWSNCADLELPTENWPGCGEANAQTFSLPQAGPHVTFGIFDVYIYGNSMSMCICPDDRVGFAEHCDGSDPAPLCFQTTDPQYFGCLGFNGESGYNPCSIVPAEEKSWGAVKSLYR